MDFGPTHLQAVRARAERLGLKPGVWVRAVVLDALLASRSEELHAAVAAALVGLEARAQASADVRALAAQIRPLAINLNDLDRRARAGEPITVDTKELIELRSVLRQIRDQLGDRGAT